MKAYRYKGIKEVVLVLGDWLFVLRPTLFFPYWTMILAGAGLSGQMSTLTPMIALYLTLLLATTNLMNNIRDLESDRKNQKLPWLWIELIPVRAATIYLVILTFTGLGGMAFTGKWYPLAALVILVVGSNVLYNLPPFAFKDKSWGSFIISALYGASFWVVGALVTGKPATIEWIALLGYTTAYTAISILAMMMDIQGDAPSRKKTFAVVLGYKKTAWIAFVLVVISVIDAALRRDLILGIPSAASLPLFILVALKPGSRKILLLTARVPVVLLSLAVGIAYAPVYLALIALYYPLARWYHRVRFDMDYPSFTSG